MGADGYVRPCLAVSPNCSHPTCPQQPENILVGADGYVRLTDMGFAKVVPIKTYTMCGTPDYMAPEVVINKVGDLPGGRGEGRGT